MRRIALCSVIGLFLLSVTSPVSAEEDGRVYYKNGTRLEFPDFDMKVNVQLQPKYSFEDLDVKDRRNNGVETDLVDRSNFDMRRARLVLSGNLLEKQFSYKLQQDFASENGGGELQDAWIQWNGEMLNIRMGQFKLPLGREERISSTNLYFTERSGVTELFAPSRAQGVQGHIPFSMGNFYSSIDNGTSTGEGQNREGIDSEVRGHWALDLSTETYGSRGVEGDFREDSDFGGTFGVAVGYGQGDDEIGGRLDTTTVNIDAGLRVCGFDLYGEWFWQQVDITEISDNISGAGKPENNGVFISAMMNFMENKMGAGFRWGYMEPDTSIQDVTGIDDFSEYTFVLNYFINGHNLKLQNGLNWRVISPQNGEDVEDFRYDLMLAGYF